MGRINVYLPDELYRQVANSDLKVSSICQKAIQSEIQREKAKISHSEAISGQKIEVLVPLEVLQELLKAAHSVLHVDAALELPPRPSLTQATDVAENIVGRAQSDIQGPHGASL